MLFATLLHALTLVSIATAIPLARKQAACISANNLITIAPDTTSCDGSPFPSECAPASVAAPNIAQSFSLFNIDSFGAQAALVAIMLFESGDFKYKINHFPGVAGQGTRNMQSPSFNAKYADWIAANGQDASITQGSVAAVANEPAALLDLINTDEWSFASAAWFLSTQCDGSQIQALGDGSQASFEAYLTGCIGTTVTEDRIAGWEKVISLGRWSS
ncbi:hypothetical protein Q7P35_011238 [Cladosporium inversicolor]